VKVALFGATGMIGSQITRELLDRGHEVTAVMRDTSRDVPRHHSLTLVEGDVTDSDREIGRASCRERV